MSTTEIAMVEANFLQVQAIIKSGKPQGCVSEYNVVSYTVKLSEVGSRKKIAPKVRSLTDALTNAGSYQSDINMYLIERAGESEEGPDLSAIVSAAELPKAESVLYPENNLFSGVTVFPAMSVQRYQMSEMPESFQFLQDDPCSMANLTWHVPDVTTFSMNVQRVTPGILGDANVPAGLELCPANPVTSMPSRVFNRDYEGVAAIKVFRAQALANNGRS